MAGDDLSIRLIDSTNATHGVHPGYRAAHAKGVLCAATFTPTAAAAALSRAAHFAKGPVRAHVRFSHGSGNPTSPDTARTARGMATKFYLPDGSTTDVVAISLPAFVARTPEDLLAVSEARRPDPETGQPDMEKIGAYLEAHPEALTALQAAMTHPFPASYTTLTYRALHSFGFVAADGSHQWVRYHFVPERGDVSITDEEAATRSPDYLTEVLADYLPSTFVVRVQLAGDGDPIDDPTAVWPDEREFVDLGRLVVTGIATDRERGGDILVFDPTRVTDGIVCSNDPILLARSGAYRESVRRRTAT